MSIFHVHYDGTYRVCETPDGIRHQPIPSAVFPSPRRAITYAAMREARVSPVRSSEGAATDLPQSSPLPSERLTPFGK